MCTILVLFMCTTLVLFATHKLLQLGVTERGRSTERGCIQIFSYKQTNFSAPFIYNRTSLRLPLQLALRDGHMDCSWPLPRLLLVCTTVVHVLFVATPL